MKNFKNTVPWIYSILSYFFFGGMIFTMMTQYPNWDYNLPDSMVIRNQFYAKTDPGTFFQFFGPIINFVFVGMIILRNIGDQIFLNNSYENWIGIIDIIKLFSKIF